MGFKDLFFRKPKQDMDEMRALIQSSAAAAVRPLRAGRQTDEQRWNEQFGWYDGVISRGDLRSPNVMENLKIIRDLNPDASMAIWNFLRLANSGHELEALTPRGKVEKKSTELLKPLAARVGSLYGGGADQLINVLTLTALTQGAVALEVELTEELNEVVDFHAIDPSTLEFRRNKETGEIELVQKERLGQYKVLNREQVFYFPIDPDIGDPYGRSPILPILQVIFFQIEVMKDLKRVVHHQGYERFDISVVEEAIMNNMPDHIKNSGPQAVSEYVSSYVNDIQTQMANLEPDDDFFHTDSVKIETAGGAGSKSMDATRVIDVINQQVVTALKQLPILLGRNEGTTETHGTIQWQIYVAGIENIQRSIKRLLEKAYNVSLQIYGRQRNAKVTFNRIRTTDRLKDAQAEEVETRTKVAQYNQGWITNDEASLEIVGHEAVEEPKPNVQTKVNLSSSLPADEDDDEEDDEKEERFSNVRRLKKKAK